MSLTACLSNDLDLFTNPNTNVSTVREYVQEYRPISAVLNATSVQFDISTGDYYTDLRDIFLRVKFRVRKTNAAGALEDLVAAEAGYSLAYDTFQALFQQIDVVLNDRTVSGGYNGAAYVGHINNLLDYSEPSFLTSEGMLGKNTVLDTERTNLVSNSKDAFLMGKLYTDLATVDKLFLNFLNIKLKLTLNKDAFIVNYIRPPAVGAGLQPADLGQLSFILEDATLYLKHVVVNAQVAIAHEKALAVKPATYPYIKTDVRQHVISAGVDTVNVDNVILGRFPHRIKLVFVDSEALAGHQGKNPFLFEHADIEFLTLYVNDIAIPANPYTPDFSNDDYHRVYLDLFLNNGSYGLDAGSPKISFKDFKDHSTIYTFSITPTGDERSGPIDDITRGTIRLKAKFKAATRKNYTAIFISEWKNILQITKDRQVQIVDL